MEWLQSNWWRRNINQNPCEITSCEFLWTGYWSPRTISQVNRTCPRLHNAPPSVTSPSTAITLSRRNVPRTSVATPPSPLPPGRPLTGSARTHRCPTSHSSPLRQNKLTSPFDNVAIEGSNAVRVNTIPQSVGGDAFVPGSVAAPKSSRSHCRCRFLITVVLED